MEQNTSTYTIDGGDDITIDVLLVCALKDEYTQVLAVTDGLLSPGWVEKPGPSGHIVAEGRFATPTGTPLTIRATWASHMGREQAQALTSKLISDYPTTRCIAMSGICAGRRGDVALGDMIFADRLWSYDAGKIKVENGEDKFQGDLLQYRPGSAWKQRMQHVFPSAEAPWLAQRPRLPLEYQEDWVLLRILAGVDPRRHADFNTECPNWSDVLPRLLDKRKWIELKCKWFKKDLSLTPAGRKKAEELELLYPHKLPDPPVFRIHVAPMATGAAVIEDERIFHRLADSMRKVLGIDMEASALGALAEIHDLPVVVAKGVSDYGDPLKDNRYREFAARASAECLIILLRESIDLLLELGSDNSVDMATLIQKGVADIHKRFDDVDQELNSLTEKPELYGDGVLAEHHGTDALCVLEGILKRRASFGQDTMGELRQLANHVGDRGKFRAAPASIKAEIYNWIARMAASSDLVPDAEKAIETVKILGGTSSPITLSWLDVARGDVDAGLQRLRVSNDAESRSNIFAILRRKKGNQEALSYFDSLEKIYPEQFTAIGWRNVVGCLAEAERLGDATEILLTLPDDYVSECPVLGYVSGIVYAAHLVSEDYRYRVIDGEFLYANEHLIEGASTEKWQQRARDAFQSSIEAAREVNDSELNKSATDWARWLNLIDPLYKEDELAKLATDMIDGNKAIDILPFAINFRVEFDPAPIEKHLTRAETLGGLTNAELNAKLLLLRYFKKFPELAYFIEDNWDRLLEVGSIATLGGELIGAYVSIGECGRAEEVLNDKETDLYPLDVPRFRLMIDQCRGKDPTLRAKEIFESSGAIEDLWNLVYSLESKRRWSDLKPYALSLFEREQNSETALRVVECLRQTNAPDEDIIAFLNKCTDLVNLNAELKSAKAWALYHLGDVEKARRLNDQLLIARKNVNDLGLDINLAARMGDWERFTDIVAREWEGHSDLPTHMLLHIAKLAGWQAKDRAIKLAEEVVERHPDDPNILMQAYSIPAALARDDIAMPWLYRAAQLSKEDEGPITSHSFREVVEIMKDRGDDWQRKNDLFRSGKIPMHWAVSMFNVPLSRFLITIPRENKGQADARKRYPIPVRSGTRHSIDVEGVSKLLLDITSIFLLSELGLLIRVLNAVEEIYLSPRTMEVLLYEREKVAFHQPSRIDAVKPLIEMYRSGHIKLAYGKRHDALVEEIGEESATLLGEAKQNNGLCIHSGTLYRVGSYMDEEADLGEFANYLANPLVVANTLHEEGRITSAIQTEALAFLSRVSNDEVTEIKLAPGAPVFLDRVSTQYLAEAGLLTELVNTGRKVLVHASAVEEWEALVATEPHTEEMVKSLENIRQILRAGMTDQKVKFIREGKRDEDDGRLSIIEMPVIDLFSEGGCVDAVCIDDRYLNSMPFLEDRKGRKVPLICSLDVIDMLVDREEITDAERREAIHLMREWTLFTLPIEEKELSQLLLARETDEEGKLNEGAELRVIREYLARLHSADVLCSAPDLDYLDGLWRTGQAVINKLWLDETNTVEVIEARADWVVDHIIPDIELATRFAPDRDERLEQIAVARLMSVLFPPNIPIERRKKYAEWLNRKIIATNFPANIDLIKKLVDQTSDWVVMRVKEIVDELES